MSREHVTHRGVRLPLYSYRDPRSGRDGWRFAYPNPKAKGGWSYGTRTTKKAAKEAAKAKAIEIADGTLDLATLTDDQKRIARAFLDLKPTWNDLDRFRQSRQFQSVPVHEAVEKFIQAKEAAKGLSNQNVKTLAKHLRHLVRDFGDKQIAELRKPDLDEWLRNLRKRDSTIMAPRTRAGIRNSVVTFFRWAQGAGFLPEGSNEAARTEKPIVPEKEPETYSPEEIAAMLKKARPQYLPWLVCSAFMGFRHDELWPDPGSRKRPLKWEDWNLDEGLIVVPKATSKTRRRIVPILRPVLDWITPKDSGPVCTGKPPQKSWRGEDSETKRLGTLVGGWRPNALRDSFISYRAAMVGIGQTAMEAGNSESEAKRSYLNAKSKAEAKRWFQVKPGIG